MEEKEKEKKQFLPTNNEISDETDALPPALRYSNSDMLCTAISIFTYLFDLVILKRKKHCTQAKILFN